MDQFNPYAAPDAPLTEDATASSPLLPSATGPANEQELRLIVGPKADHYLNKWRSRLDTPGPVGALGFNWAGFLFSGFWLPYRKMYKAGLILYAAVLGVSVGEELIIRFLPRDVAPGIALAGRLVSLVVSIVVGSYGNGWYLNHARRVVAETRTEATAEGLSAGAYAALLSRRGGVNALIAFGMFLAFIAASVVIGLLFGGFAEEG
jgi:hypothetical protein